MNNNINTMLPVEFFVAIRYLKATKNNFFSALTTFISFSGITLGVSVLIVTLAIMNGFQNDIKNRILGVQPHIIITKINNNELAYDLSKIKNKIYANKNVISISPFAFKQGVISSSKSKLTSGTSILIKAIDYKDEDKMLNISNKIIASDIRFDFEKIGKKSIILGSELAKNISVDVGDKIILMFPDNFFSIPKMYEFSVSSIVQSGIYDFDSSFGLIDLDEWNKTFSMINSKTTGFDAYIHNFYDALTVSSQIRNNLPCQYTTKTWIEMNKNLFSALKLEKIIMFLILLFIVLVATSNIVSNLLLLSMQKIKDIGIMLAVGYSKYSISKIFFYEGIIISFIGIFFGVVLGLIVSLALKWFNIFKLPKGVYYVDRLPVDVTLKDILMIVVIAFVITILSEIYPIYRISKFDPIKIMKESK
ncbi:MAG: ABC transporter permease [Endomicrobium sp.]|jgi:lipoprotein-releasing system permease protein|nr:ABC transporter permease [Endomicrobium sp.]